MPSLTAVILAAGEGTRMRSQLPKMLHSLCGRPLVGWPIAAALDAGADRVVVVDSSSNGLEGRLPAHDAITRVVQPAPNGTGGALQAAASQIDRDGTVVVMPGDVPLITGAAISALVAKHNGSRAAATMATMTLDDPTGYGRVVRDDDGHIERVVETKTPGDATREQLAIHEVNSSIFAFDGGALLDALDSLSPENAQGELYLPDVLPAMRAAGHAIRAYEVRDRTHAIGVNDRVQLGEVRAIAQKRIHDAHRRAGVNIVDAGTTLIDIEVQIGEDTTIEPSTFVRGSTTIGRGCTIGPLTTLIDATLHDEVTVPHSYVVGAEIESQAHRWPFAYLRPGTVLRELVPQRRHVRRDQSLDVGRGSKVRMPTSRRHRHRPALRSLAPRRSRPTTTAPTSTARRSAIASTLSVDTTPVAPVTLGDDSDTAANSAHHEDVLPQCSASPASASRTSRATPFWSVGTSRSTSSSDDHGPAAAARQATCLQLAPTTRTSWCSRGAPEPRSGPRGSLRSSQFAPVWSCGGRRWMRRLPSSSTAESDPRADTAFLVGQPICANPGQGMTPNDVLMELLLMIDAAVAASAHRVIAVTPRLR